MPKFLEKSHGIGFKVIVSTNAKGVKTIARDTKRLAKSKDRLIKKIQIYMGNIVTLLSH